jgi:hypothetical protein
MDEPLMTTTSELDDIDMEVENELEKLSLDEEEEPSWVRTAREALDDSNQEKQQTADHYPSEIEDLKIRLKQAQDWRPRPRHEVEEHRLALEQRKCSLMQDQNKLLGLLVEILEEGDGYTRMKSNQVKKIIERYDW